MDNIERLIKATLLKTELIEIDNLLKSKIENNNILNIILIKNIFITISNVSEFESTIRSMYKEHPELSEIYSKAKKEFEFAKYIRNKFIGHITSELIQNSIEWRPELKYLHVQENTEYLYHLFILETAINTYVDSNGKHKIFSNDTDLMYPADIDRFLEYLDLIVKVAIEFLTKLSNILKSKIDKSSLEKIDLRDWIKAVRVDFKYIKKGKR